MNITNANVEPYRRYHEFHEQQLNVTVKALTASVHHTILQLSTTAPKTRLGDLIREADPSWSMPPIWDHDADLTKAMFDSIAKLGVVSVYSALDDFRVGIEAEIARWKSHSGQTCLPSALGDDRGNALQGLLELYGWLTPLPGSVTTVLGYFGLLRNCIAHRNSRASMKLADVSVSQKLLSAYESLPERPNISLPKFERGEVIRIHPTLAILYSHLGRMIAKHVNQQLVPLIGADGILRMAIWHACSDEPPPMRSTKSIDGALNALLADRYRVHLEDAHEAPKRARRLGLWKRFETARTTPCQSDSRRG